MQLKNLRLKAGLTQAQAAAHVGASLRAWQAWESASASARPVPPHVLEKMHALTGTPQPGKVTAVWMRRGAPVTVQSDSIRGLVSLLVPLMAGALTEKEEAEILRASIDGARAASGAPLLTSAQVVSLANDLARELYAIQGYVAPAGYKFYTATHPQEVAAWRGACLAFEWLQFTDVQDALTDLEGEA